MKTTLQDTCINTIRFLAADAVEKAKSGHPGAPMGLAPLAYVLWSRYMKYNPRNPEWFDRDRFVLSAGHASMLLYSMLYLTGYDLSLEDIKAFRQWGSRTPGHPEFRLTPGVETTTGPLGQGFSNGVGMAIAERFLSHYFNRPGFEIVNHSTYGIVSDGDLMEGVSQEAASIAGHIKLGKLLCFYDSNRTTIDGKTELTFSENVKTRFESMGWQVAEIRDGNRDLEGIARAIEAAQREKTKPSLVIVNTNIAFGCPNKQDSAEAHGAPLGEEEVRLTKKALGWPEDKSFYVPEEALHFYREARERGERAEGEWNKKFSAYASKFPDLARQFEAFTKGELPREWESKIPVFDQAEPRMATRSASGKILNALAEVIPNMIGGSADLAQSTNTFIKNSGSFLAGNPGGRNIHFGVREHSMGGVVSGMALHGGLVPFAGTFFVFSDYFRPAIRLASIMGLHPIFIFSHDSIGVGEDGPTHQPVEHLMSLRAMPGIVLIRPADCHETRGAWRVALKRRDGPTVMVLTRQTVPVLGETKALAWEGVPRGAYVLSETDPSRCDIILMASGSEVHLALGAKQALEKKGKAARVVSMPSWELFDAQAEGYRESVLPSRVKKRLAIEAGVTRGWAEYVGPEGGVVGLDHFGASAPGNVVMEKLGFTVDNIIEKALAVLGRG